MGSTQPLRAALAQINTTVGDLPGNRRLVERAYAQAIEAGASVIVFPELTLTGYPPEDLLLKPSFLEDTRATLDRFTPQVTEGLVILGFADGIGGNVGNAAALIARQGIVGIYHKCTLPNYGVFDERRYFRPGARCPVYAVGPWRIAINICEDLWDLPGVPTLQAARGKANLMINLSASPYHAGKGAERERLVAATARDLQLPVLYTNLVGGQDELVFDGQSIAVDATGKLLARAPQFRSCLLLVDLPAPPKPNGAGAGSGGANSSPDAGPSPPGDPCEALHCDLVTLGKAESSVLRLGSPAAASLTRPADSAAAEGQALPPEEAGRDARPLPIAGGFATPLPREEEIYRGLELGLRDYAKKNAFQGVVIGLSGGIDSALTAVIAADALGSDAVVGISMPSQYSSESSQAGARQLAHDLGIEFYELPIDALFGGMVAALSPTFGGAPEDVTEENIQARLRGTMLMAFSNKRGHLVLATGNKSEVAVGYCTLYGDMVGGFSVLKDVLKTHVYRLARWRNELTPEAPPIPEDTLSRPPSAELRPDQKDTDSLLPYDVLDPLIQSLVEREMSPRQLVATGAERADVDRVVRMIQGNEYKRRQAAPGIKITPRAFGKDHRYPLTNRYRPGEV